MILGPELTAVSGVSTHLNQLMSSQLRDSFDFVHYVVGSEGRDESRLQKIRRLLLGPFFFARSLGREKPDIVHLNSSLVPKAYWRDLLFMLVAATSGVKVVFQIHGGRLPQEFLGDGRLAHSFLRWSLNKADAVVVLASIEEKAYAEFGVSSLLRRIPNAIDLKDYAGARPKNLSGPGMVLGYFGRIFKDKGIFEALEAMGRLHEQGMKNITLRMCGSGPDLVRLRQEVSRKGLKDAVSIEAPVFGADKVRFLREIDVFLFPTYHEGLPYALLEALASGTPVITTRVGAIPDVVREGRECAFVEVGSAGEIVEAVKGLLANPEGYARMSQACLRRADEYYGIERLQRQFGELYGELL